MSSAVRTLRVDAAARPRDARRQAVLLPALLALFFCSGISGLTYEVVWVRYLALVFGVTIYAISTVLTVFMGGLALGGYAAGRVAGRLRRPLRAYGLVEIGIGLSALLTPAVFALLNAVYRALYPAVPHDLTSLSLVRFVLSCAVLLVPTTLMGATLPIVIRSTLGTRGSLGTSLSLLYASNTAGGIAGAYLAGFVLIGGAGVRATTLIAAAVNIAVGLAAMGLDALLGGSPETHPVEEAARSAGDGLPAQGGIAAAEPSPQPSPRRRGSAAAVMAPSISAGAVRWLQAALVASGLASLGYQVIWTRVLSIYFDATTYVFSLILCTFLFGLAAGSYLIAPLINRRANWLLIVAAMEWAVGLTAILSIAATSSLPRLVALMRLLPLGMRLTSSEQRVTAVMAALTMVPTTVLLGAAFPVVLRLCSRSPATPAGPTEAEDQGVTRRLGRAYAANVTGSIVGSWASGFVLVPVLGAQRSLVLLAALNVTAAIGILRHALPRRSLPAGSAAILATILAVALAPDLYRAVFSHFGDSVLWYEEGLEQTVTVTAGPTQRRMFLNGRHQADDTEGTVIYHALIGHLPLLLLPEPAGPTRDHQVLVIGLGGGVTAGAAAAHERTQLDVVELSDSVIRGAAYFTHVNDDVLHATNVHLITDDGRNFLALTSKRYDVVMADVIRPQHAGSGVLYSREYFQAAHDALTDTGLMIQWVDSQLPQTQYQLLLRTFLDVFPYATGWVDGSFIVGSKTPYPIDRRLVAERLGGHAGAATRRIGLVSVESVLNLFAARDDELRAFAGFGPEVSDDHPYVEFFRSLPHDPAPADLSRFSRDPAPLLR